MERAFPSRSMADDDGSKEIEDPAAFRNVLSRERTGLSRGCGGEEARLACPSLMR